ncbi:MAG: aldehyde ferredoxin oxidoreductase N-terminal domain-containing protein, partial [Chloroflexota bacterium]|nr:aldehyde ferredoxin oxidoreductase N-terminal domain-containing protein [Chloroflexota bacterium]
MALGGYMGKLLRVDLNSGRITEEMLDEGVLRDYVGGMGLGAKYLYDEVDPQTPWDDPANRLIFASGPLGGTRLDGSGSYSVTSKGPLTDGAGCSQANGYFGAYLKFCGYDAVIVQGKAKRWLYLSIDDGKAELREAGHLVGKDTWETEALIKAELGKKEKQASVFSIGPAGENLVKFAAIVGDKGHVAGHNGLGAVMGAKKLKAVVAARGHRIPKIAEPEKFRTLAQELFDLRKDDPVIGQRHNLWGTSTLYSITEPLGRLPVRNMTSAIFGQGEKFNGPYYRAHWKIKPNPCWACRN